MSGTVAYYTDFFKSVVMNNLGTEKPSTLQNNYYLLKTEISESARGEKEKENYLRNVEKAYIEIRADLFGMEEEDYGD